MTNTEIAVALTDDEMIARGEALKAERDEQARKDALARAEENRRMNPFADAGIGNDDFGPLMAYIITKHHGQDVAAFLEDKARKAAKNAA